MAEEMERPKVGIGAIVLNSQGKVLLGRRKNAHGEGSWAFPGGHLEAGESFAGCARREVMEETGLEVAEFRCVGVTNDIFAENDKHYVTIFMMGKSGQGEPEIREPHKCEGWGWFSFDSLPRPLFLTIENLLASDPENSLCTILPTV